MSASEELCRYCGAFVNVPRGAPYRYLGTVLFPEPPAGMSAEEYHEHAQCVESVEPMRAVAHARQQQQKAEELRPMKVILDHYDNPAVVTAVDDYWVRYVQLTGSDFGRTCGKPRADVEAQIAGRPASDRQIEWAKGRWAELNRRGR